MNRLISYPRSGNHWVRFIIEYLSNRPTINCVENKKDKTKKDIPIYKNIFYSHGKRVSCPIYIDKRKDPIFLKQHTIEEGPPIINDDKVILIIRDWKEAILRHGQHEKAKSFSEMRKLPFAAAGNRSSMEHLGYNLLTTNEIDIYFKLLDFYDKFNGKKLLIKYEDLINNVELVAYNIYNFLELKNKKLLIQFIENKNELSDISRSIKNSKPISKNDLNYHKRNAAEANPSIDFKVFDEYVIKNYAELISKYNISI